MENSTVASFPNVSEDLSIYYTENVITELATCTGISQVADVSPKSLPKIAFEKFKPWDCIGTSASYFELEESFQNTESIWTLMQASDTIDLGYGKIYSPNLPSKGTYGLQLFLSNEDNCAVSSFYTLTASGIPTISPTFIDSVICAPQKPSFAIQLDTAAAYSYLIQPSGKLTRKDSDSETFLFEATDTRYLNSELYSIRSYTLDTSCVSLPVYLPWRYDHATLRLSRIDASMDDSLGVKFYWKDSLNDPFERTIQISIDGNTYFYKWSAGTMAWVHPNSFPYIQPYLYRTSFQNACQEPILLEPASSLYLTGSQNVKGGIDLRWSTYTEALSGYTLSRTFP